jgi:hypothetical protein
MRMGFPIFFGNARVTAMRLVLVAATCLVLSSCAKECEIISLPSSVTKMFYPSWHGQGRQCRVGNYYVIGPPDAAAEKADNSLWVVKDGKPMVMISGQKEINIFSHTRSVLSIQDRAGNGSFNFVSYDVTDSNGKYIGSVTDGDMRGQPGFKLMNDGKAYVYINGSWLLLERHGEQPGVLGPSGWQAVRLAGLFRYEVASK